MYARLTFFRDKWCWLMGLLLFGLSTHAQPNLPNGAMPGEFYFTKKQRKVVIPFQMVHNLMIVPLRINNSDTMRFVVDTGVQTALLTSLHAGESLDLSYFRRTSLSGLGEGEDVEVLHSYGNAFHLAGLSSHNQHLFVLMQDIFMLSTKLGVPIHGLLGYDLFKDKIVRIDYQARTLTLYDPARFRLSGKRKHQAIPIEIEQGKPYVRVEVAQADGTQATARLLIDTGASLALSLDCHRHDDLSLPEKTVEAYIGRGLRGNVCGHLGRVKALRIGDFELHDIPTAFPDEAALSGMSAHQGRQGLVGADVLRRFEVIFDYPRQTMYLRPQAAFRQPIEHDLSGLELYTPMPGLRFYVIEQVIPGSPADRAGLAPEDELITVNGQHASRYTLDDLITLLRSQPGKRLRLRVLRDGQELSFTFRLERQI